MEYFHSQISRRRRSPSRGTSRRPASSAASALRSTTCSSRSFARGAWCAARGQTREGMCPGTALIDIPAQVASRPESTCARGTVSERVGAQRFLWAPNSPWIGDLERKKHAARDGRMNKVRWKTAFQYATILAIRSIYPTGWKLSRTSSNTTRFVLDRQRSASKPACRSPRTWRRRSRRGSARRRSPSPRCAAPPSWVRCWLSLARGWSPGSAGTNDSEGKLQCT